MAVADILEPILEGGMRDAHFFNGRILTAEALRTMQEANALQHRQLATAIGEGVAYGLRVSLAATDSPTERPKVHVGPGLAFNRLGEAVALNRRVELALVRQIERASIEAGRFTECTPPGFTFTNFGIYILTVMPASGFSGFASMVELGEGGVGTGCGRAYQVEGVKFRLIEVPTDGLSGTPLEAELSSQANTVDAQSLSLLGAGSNAITPAMFLFRSIVAHYFLTSDHELVFATDPFAPSADDDTASRDPLERMRRQTPPTLHDCEVPLAMLHWSRRGVEFIDEWAVRRALFAPAPSDAMAQPFADKRTARALARILQFQSQADDILLNRTDAELSLIRAADYFRYLPSAGLLPRPVGGFRGFTVDRFLQGRPFRALQALPTLPQRPNTSACFIAGQRLRPLFRSALGFPPLDLSDQEMIWLYTVWQNQKAIDDGGAVVSYVAFAAPHVPPIAEARFDIARFDYSNYGDCGGCDQPGRIATGQ